MVCRESGIICSINPTNAITFCNQFIEMISGINDPPLHNYGKIVMVVTTSEGLTKREIDRHRWTHLLPMWNMSRDGFEELYNQDTRR